MLDFLRGVQGVRLTREEYKRDFAHRWAGVPAFDCWKLERRQYFAEPWSDSWVAFTRGDWAEVVRLEEAGADATIAELQEAARRGIRPLRVRVVEKPLTPYMLWELYVFQTQVAAGERIRVVDPEVVAPFETDAPLPELLSVGTETLYQALYEDDGPSVGAIRFSRHETAASYVAFMERLWTQGEDYTEFFTREVAPLMPFPAGTA